MNHAPERLTNRLIRWWDRNVLDHPWMLLALFVFLCGLSLHYTLTHLQVDTDTADVISTEVPFQQNRIRLETAFPQDVSTILLLVEGPTPEQTGDAVRRLGAELRRDRDNFKSVYIPDEDDFFVRNGLLYLDPPQLDRLAVQLAGAQPFLGRIAADNSLRGFLGIVGEALTESKKFGLELDIQPLLAKLREAIVAVSEGRPYRLSWQQLMLAQGTGLGLTKRFIIITPRLHFEELLPAAQAIGALDRILARVLKGDLAEVKVRKTGEVVLEHEEMQTIGTGVSAASVASLVLVCLILWLAYRSLRLMFATFVSLTMGLILSMGFAALAIGRLNLISIGFSVLFIGMGDAYSSHFCLRYRELVLRGHPSRAALRETLASTGSALVLSALTAAIGLYAYIPTTFSGVAELGIIAGTSMFIALATTFTVLPALMKLLPLPPQRRAPPGRRPLLLSNWPLRYAPVIRWATLALAAGAAWLLPGVTVDFNPLNLRDPDTESVKTFKYLLQSEDTSPMTLAALAQSEAEARDKIQRFQELPTVDRVMSVLQLIPEEQAEKLATIEDLALIMGPQLDRFPPPRQGQASFEAVEKFHGIVRRAAAAGDGELEPLDQALAVFRARLDGADADTRQALLDQLQSSLLALLPTTIDRLRESLKAQPITLDALPKDLVARWVSPDGLYRLQIFPKKDLNDLDNLREFILEAQRVDPNVTDLPVTYLESMEEVIKAFQQAFAIAFGATTLLLLLLLRSVKDTLLVLLPLLLASLFTAAATVLLEIPFNFANIIALPLLFGLGVDNGIHMAHRLHYLKPDENLLGTSEAQGVFYGALTTVVSFSSLAFTSHRGTASLGLLLSIGLLLTLACALIVLPAFSTLRLPRRH
ncbi:MMPL family transporter [Candidatus Methylocalor cossyra]|uniref:Membrane transport protein MMPL domain-containing protein n=1 Tax=Candidatus Methylocalor cossyra TaxID=3108543 RepID=A0ABM9NFF6_9GAMM